MDDDLAPVVDMPPISSQKCTIYVEPKCAICGHKHEDMVTVCKGCVEGIKREWQTEERRLSDEQERL